MLHFPGLILNMILCKVFNLQRQEFRKNAIKGQKQLNYDFEIDDFIFYIFFVKYKLIKKQLINQ